MPKAPHLVLLLPLLLSATALHAAQWSPVPSPAAKRDEALTASREEAMEPLPAEIAIDADAEKANV